MGDRPHPVDEVARHVFLEKVGHRTVEIDRGFPAPERLIQGVLPAALRDAL